MDRERNRQYETSPDRSCKSRHFNGWRHLRDRQPGRNDEPVIERWQLLGGPTGGHVVDPGGDAFNKTGASSSQAGMSSSQQAGTAGAQSNPALVRSVQQALKDKGHDAGAIDGQMGPSTESALRSFQQAQGLPPSGTLDQQTLSALNVQQDQGAMPSQASPSGSQSQASPMSNTQSSAPAK